ARAWRRKLNHAPVVAGHKVRIESPAEAGVERLGTLDVRNGNDDDLELHVDRARRRGIGWSCHGSLLWLAPAPDEVHACERKFIDTLDGVELDRVRFRHVRRFVELQALVRFPLARLAIDEL